MRCLIFFVTLTDSHNSVAVGVLSYLGAVYVRMILFIVECCAVAFVGDSASHCTEVTEESTLDVFVFSCTAFW